MWLWVDRVIASAVKFFQENDRLEIENVRIVVHSALVEPRACDLAVLSPGCEVRKLIL